MNEGRRLSDREFITWAISQVPRYWKVAAGVVVGIFTFASAFSVTAYQMRVNDAVQKSDHVEIGSLKEDMAAIKVKVGQIDDLRSEIRDLRNSVHRDIGKAISKNEETACLDEDALTRKIIEGLKVMLDNKRRR